MLPGKLISQLREREKYCLAMHMQRCFLFPEWKKSWVVEVGAERAAFERPDPPPEAEPFWQW